MIDPKFAAMLPLKYVHPDAPVVPSWVYPTNIGFNRYLRWRPEAYDENDQLKPECRGNSEPVVMRGAWEVMVQRYRPKNLAEKVVDRYMRLYRLSTLYTKERERVVDRLSELMYKSGKYKRRFYSGCRFCVFECVGFPPYSAYGHFYLLGRKFKAVDYETFTMLKLLRRKLNRLDQILPTNKEGEDKWLQLLQQAN